MAKKIIIDYDGEKFLVDDVFFDETKSIIGKFYVRPLDKNGKLLEGRATEHQLIRFGFVDDIVTFGRDYFIKEEENKTSFFK